MYWVVLACALLVESWTDWLLVWYVLLTRPVHSTPDYPRRISASMRICLTRQWAGSRFTLISASSSCSSCSPADARRSHSSARSASIPGWNRTKARSRTSSPRRSNACAPPASPTSSALRRAPPGQGSRLSTHRRERCRAAAAAQATTPGSYTQRFSRASISSARWDSAAGAAGAAGTDFYNLLASAVNAATNAASGAASAGNWPRQEHRPADPDSIRGTTETHVVVGAQRRAPRDGAVGAGPWARRRWRRPRSNAGSSVG